MDRRPAGTADIEAATRCITLAFATDPIWSVALGRIDGRTDHHEPYWRLFVAGAVAHGNAFILGEGAAVSVWIPPGGAELDAAETAELETLLARSLEPADVAAMHDLFDRFEASRARVPRHHAYLSLLATHPDHRGRGIGQALLADDLAWWDQQGIPAYLESTNPANDHRYVRAGFVPIGGFHAVRDAAPVTAMWRDVPGEVPLAA